MFGPAMRTVHLAITDFMCQAQLAAEEFIHQNDQVRAIWSSFPSGCEEHIKVMGPVNGNHVRINARIQTNAELMRLFLATDAVRRMGAKSVSLFIPYLPYARQDRVCNPGEALSASVMAKMINSQGYTSVISLDPHSDVMPALLNNYTTMRFVGHVMDAKADHPNAVFCAPDLGAMKRVDLMSSAVGNANGICFTTKRREDGRVIPGAIMGADILNKEIIIVGDICDGGRTFIELSKKLRVAGAKKVYLAVTHGLFTHGLDALFNEGIDAIYTTNSFMRDEIDESRINRTEI